MRQPSFRSMAITYPAGTAAVPTPPGWDHLIYASSGVLTVTSDDGRWVIPPHRALWAPSGRPYGLTAQTRLALRSLYFRTELAVLGDEWRAVNVTPLLRELILHTTRVAPLDLDDPRHARLVGTIVDLFVTLPQAPLQLPAPTDPRARALAALIESQPDLPTAAAARSVGASRRTLERLFAAETSMTIGQWRQRLALVRALQLLASGAPVTTVATEVGYSTPSAFGAMFRAHMGVPPGRYFKAVG